MQEDAIDGSFLGDWIGSIILWNALIWLTWWILKKRNGMIAVIPCGFILGWNLLQQGQKAPFFIAYLFLVIVITAITSYRAQTLNWDNQKIDWPYPGSFLPEWMTAAGVFALILCSVAYLFVTLATPEGWQQIQRAIENRQTELAVSDQTMQPDQDPNPNEGISYFGKNLVTPSLDEIGEPPSSSKATLFWVSVSSPNAAGGFGLMDRSFRWRMQIFDAYTQQGWQEVNLPGSPIAEPGDLDSPPRGRERLQQDFRISAAHGTDLPSANQPFQIEDAELLFVSPDSALAIGSGNTYSVSSWVSVPAEMDLVHSTGVISPEILDRYLDLPANFPARITDLAMRITEGVETDYEKSIRIQEFLRKNYSYSLTTPAPPAGRDVVDYFLFNAREGFCSYYASSMVVMLRAVGVPARIVSGYAKGEFDAGIKAFRVTPADAHAWVEVYFPDYGWVEFEPTPAYPAPRYGLQKEETLSIQIPLDRITAILLVIIRWLLIGLTVGGVLFMMFKLLSGKKKVTLPVVPAQLLYWKLRQKLSAAGVRLEPSLTPRESLVKLQETFLGDSVIIEASTHITRLHENSLFGISQPHRSEYDEAVHHWRSIVYPLTWMTIKQKFYNLKNMLAHRENLENN